MKDAENCGILQQCNCQLFCTDQIKFKFDLRNVQELKKLLIINWNDPFGTIRGLDEKKKGPLNITGCKDLYQAATLTLAQGSWRLIRCSYLSTRCACSYVGYILYTNYCTSNRRCINRMAFCMHIRCWCGGNVQGICPCVILALLISVLSRYFSHGSTWEYTGVLFNSFLIASDGKEKMWASADHCKPSDFCVMSERTRRQYGGLLCVRVQI